MATLLTGALVFDDNESLDFADSQRKEALFKHYKDKITTKINEVAVSFANSTDQHNARKIGNVIGSICTNLILAKGTAIVTEEVIGTIAKVTRNVTNIIKGETEFAATLADLEPSVKKTLTPFTTSLEEAAEIAETAHLRPSPGYRPPEPHSSTPVFGKDFGIKVNTHRQFNPAIIYGREYSGHALQRMTERGLTPMTIESAIKNGITRANKVSGRLEHLDSVNRVIAITCEKTGRVITLRFGS